jgi:hypothetical protein
MSSFPWVHGSMVPVPWLKRKTTFDSRYKISMDANRSTKMKEKNTIKIKIRRTSRTAKTVETDKE